MRTFLMLILAVVFSHAQAALLVFSSTEYDAGAQATAGSNTDQHMDTSPPHPLAVSASAFATAGTGNHGSASGLADDGVLVATAESGSVDADTSALGGATFFGTFEETPGELGLHVQFDTDGQVQGDGNALAASKLTVTLISNGDILYSDTFQAPSIVDKSFDLPADSSGSLQLALFSLAGSSNASALNASNAHFRLSFALVPEPSSMLMLLAAIPILLALSHPHNHRWPRTTISS